MVILLIGFYKGNTGVDDVFFVEALINDLAVNYNIDTSRVYACGYSLGENFVMS